MENPKRPNRKEFKRMSYNESLSQFYDGMNKLVKIYGTYHPTIDHCTVETKTDILGRKIEIYRDKIDGEFVAKYRTDKKEHRKRIRTLWEILNSDLHLPGRRK